MAVEGINGGGGAREVRRTYGRSAARPDQSPRSSESEGVGSEVDRFDPTPEGAGLARRISDLVDKLQEPESDRQERLAAVRERLAQGEFDQPEAFSKAAEHMLGKETDLLP